MAHDKEDDTCLEQGSSPNEAMFFVLAYLPLFELLSMARVCKSLRDAIDDDILPWMKIVVDWPLNRRISDGILLKIASKAKGRLQVLALINCVKITDDGLLRVVAQNPHIIKLHIPNCRSLSPGGVIQAVTLLSKNNHTLKSLRISGIPGIRNDELETLRNLINQTQHKIRAEKILYQDYKNTNADHHRSIDVDVCPKCNEVKLVFDCPRAPCQKQQQREVSECKGCESCIARCVDCGVCIANGEEMEEALCLDTLCLGCWLELPKCDFCNKPYCNKHGDRRGRVLGSTGFVCYTCDSRFI